MSLLGLAVAWVGSIITTLIFYHLLKGRLVWRVEHHTELQDRETTFHRNLFYLERHHEAELKEEIWSLRRSQFCPKVTPE